MAGIDNKYFECPKCHWAISFHLVNDKYVSLCPYCKNRLAILKEEHEKKDIEIFFKHEYL